MATPLFDRSLLPSQEHSRLPSSFSFRPLQSDDFHNGHLDPLQDLAYIGKVDEASWANRFAYMKSCPDTYFVLVITNEQGRIAGTGTLVAERKFLFETGIQGHIEDIAIAKCHQGRGLGLALLNALSHIAAEVGCYKTILDCSAKNVKFYAKCGYEQGGHEMQRYIDEKAREKNV